MALTKCEERSANIFHNSDQRQLPNSGNKIPPPKTFCNLNFQLNGIRTDQTVLLAYTDVSLKGFGNAEANFLSNML